MEFIDGITLLYDKYYPLIGIRYFCMFLATIFVVIAMIILVQSIIQKEFFDDWTLVVISLVCGALVFFGGKALFVPYSSYTVSIDETVPYTQMIDTYGEDCIIHEGGNTYQIIVYGEK